MPPPPGGDGHGGHFGSFANSVPVAAMVRQRVPDLLLVREDKESEASHESASASATFHRWTERAFLAYDGEDDGVPPRTSVLPGLANAPAAPVVGRQLARLNFSLNLRGDESAPRKDAWVFLNHGAFGAPFKHATACAHTWRKRAEQQPLRFFDRELFEHLVFAMQDVAKFMDVDDPTRVALVSNATEALNAAMNGVPWRGDGTDEAVVMDIGYGGLKKALAVVCARVNARVRTVQVNLDDIQPLDDDENNIDTGCQLDACDEPHMPELERKLIAAIDLRRTRFVLLDHVTSNTAAKLPVASLASAVRRIAPQARIAIDGAHALGALRFTRKFWDSLPADVYATNAHKWLCGCRGTAVAIALSDRARDGELRPLISSHGAGEGLTSEFIWQGNKDYSPQLALPQVLAFHRTYGASMAEHQQDLIRYAVRTLRCEPLVPLRAAHPFMACLRLTSSDNKGVPFTSTDAKNLQDWLFARGVEVPIKCLWGALYLRLSAGAYNVRGDIDALAEVLKSSPLNTTATTPLSK